MQIFLTKRGSKFKISKIPKKNTSRHIRNTSGVQIWSHSDENCARQLVGTTHIQTFQYPGIPIYLHSPTFNHHPTLSLYPFPFMLILIPLSLSCYPYPFIPIPLFLSLYPYPFIPILLSLSIYPNPFFPIPLSLSLYPSPFIPIPLSLPFITIPFIYRFKICLNQSKYCVNILQILSYIVQICNFEQIVFQADFIDCLIPIGSNIVLKLGEW